MSRKLHARDTIFRKSAQANAFLIEIWDVELKIAAASAEPIASSPEPFGGQEVPEHSFDSVLRDVKEELQQESARELRARENAVQESPGSQSARLKDKGDSDARKETDVQQKADPRKETERKETEKKEKSEEPTRAQVQSAEKEVQPRKPRSPSAVEELATALLSAFPTERARDDKSPRFLTGKETPEILRKVAFSEKPEMPPLPVALLRQDPILGRPAAVLQEVRSDKPGREVDEKSRRPVKEAREVVRLSTEELLGRLRLAEDTRQNSRDSAAEKIEVFKNTESRSRDKVVLRLEERGFSGASKEEGSNQSFLFSQQLQVRQGELQRVDAMRTLDPRDFKGMLEKARFDLEDTGRSTASIRLRPESLGVMTVNLETRGETVKGSVIVESQAALKAVERELETLRADLRLQGISVTEFSVKVRESFFSSQEFARDQNGFEMSGQFQRGREQESAADPGFFHLNGYSFEENTESYSSEQNAGLINVSA